MQRSTWKFWKMFWCRGYVGTTTPSKWCSFKTLHPRMELRKFRISWRRIFPWWSRRIFGLAAPQIWMFVTIGCLASLSNVTSHPSVNSLKAAIRRGFRNLDPEDVKRSCSRFRSRISQIIDTNGDHIEWFCSVDNKEQIYTSKNYVSTLFSYQNSEFSKSYVSPNLAARPCTLSNYSPTLSKTHFPPPFPVTLLPTSHSNSYPLTLLNTFHSHSNTVPTHTTPDTNSINGSQQ